MQEPEALPATEPAGRVGPRPGGFLVLRGGLKGYEGTIFPVFRRDTRVGRSPRCEIQIPEPRVSRVHAIIVWEDGYPILVHQSQTNKTTVNEEGIDTCRLEDGDRIHLAGRIELLWRVDYPA